jgi:anti-sigma factor RsiW
MIPCYKFKRLITDYLDSELDPVEREWFLKHQQSCPACYRLVNRTQKVVEFLRSLPPVTTEQNFIVELKKQIQPDLNRNTTDSSLNVI